MCGVKGVGVSPINYMSLWCAGHLLMLTVPATLDIVSNGTGLPLSSTFRKQPTNGDDTGTRLCFVVPEWRKRKAQFVKKIDFKRFPLSLIPDPSI